MRSYYVKRKKYYFQIERRRHRQRLIFLTALATTMAIFSFLGIRGLSQPSLVEKESGDRGKKLPLASQKKEPSEEPEKEKQPPSDNLPKVAIVIDDVGFVQTHIAKFQKIKIPLTFSVMPHSRHGKANADLFHSQGQEIMLHLPMENNPSQPTYGPGEITTKMSDDQIITTLDENLALVPYVKGINNHEGKVATADIRVMNVVIKYAKDHNLFFLDSLTTVNSVACQVQGELGMPKIANDWFIDNKDTVEDIKAQIQKLGELAKNKGVAIGIGHIQRANTAQAIQEMAPVLQSQGIEFVFLSQIPSNR